MTILDLDVGNSRIKVRVSSASGTQELSVPRGDGVDLAQLPSDADRVRVSSVAGANSEAGRGRPGGIPGAAR